MEAALRAIESAKSGEKPSYTSLAKQYGISRTTLARRHQARQAPQGAKNAAQKKLSPQQEAELVRYIKDLSSKGLPPAKETIQSYASLIANEPVSRTWVTRFLHRNGEDLIHERTKEMYSHRHKADSRTMYEEYFDMMHTKMGEYDILPCNTYNMDEKGFLFGVTGRSERVFSRAAWERGEVEDLLQDDSPEWATLLATVCADGSALPPALLFQGASMSLQSTWVAGVEAGKHEVFVGSTSSGWTNNDTGLAWVKQIFDPCTKQKARRGRDWRLLILDGHGSHITMEFIEYCVSHRILIAIFPSHSTHTLQPLDVVCFKPLSSSYTEVLTNHLQESQGTVPIKRDDFFPLFWSAWTSSFKTETILKSFEATGIWPKDPTVILKRFTDKQEELGETAPEALRAAEWSRLDHLARSAVEDVAAEEFKALVPMLHHLLTQNQLLHDETERLGDALNTERASRSAQKDKRKASRAPSKPKPKRRAGGSAAPAESLDAAPAAPPKVNSRGRTITLPIKYK